MSTSVAATDAAHALDDLVQEVEVLKEDDSSPLASDEEYEMYTESEGSGLEEDHEAVAPSSSAVHHLQIDTKLAEEDEEAPLELSVPTPKAQQSRGGRSGTRGTRAERRAKRQRAAARLKGGRYTPKNGGESSSSKTLASPYFSQQTAFYKKPEATTHTKSLALAIFIVCTDILDVATDIWLIYDFFTRGLRFPAYSLIVARMLSVLIAVLFDWLNEGRWQWQDTVLDILQLRSVLLFHRYWTERQLHMNKSWTNNDFRSYVSFEAFPSCMLSLVIQTYVVIAPESSEYVSQAQVICFIITCFTGITCLLRHFKYVSLANSAYVEMLLKAVLSTMLRTVLCATLVLELRYWTPLGILISYLWTVGFYYVAVRGTRMVRREDPLVHDYCHLFVAQAVALKLMFFSFPFAPNHSIEDWWFGYLVTECKLQMENTFMVALLAWVYSGDDNEVVMVGLFFAATVFLLNYAVLYFLHKSVKLTLFERPVYSSKLIVKLFAHLCSHYKAELAEKQDAAHAQQLGGPGASLSLDIVPEEDEAGPETIELAEQHVTTRNCPACAHQNEAWKRFCEECGENLQQ